MSELTPSYPPAIANLFAPKQPVKYIEPTDYPLEQRKLTDVSPVGSYLDVLKQYNKEYKYNSTEGLQQKEQRLKKEKTQKLQEKKAVETSNWDPLSDPHIINTDPYKTLFVGRLNYQVTELELQQFFSKFGTIKKLRLVKDKFTSKSKGYAFIEFENEKDARNCIKESRDAKLMERTMLIDVERSRLIKNWKPARLGGGIGGRHYIKKEKERDALRERRENGSFRGTARAPRGASNPRFNSRPHDRAPYNREPRFNNRGRRDGGGFRGSSYRDGRGGGGGYRGRY